MIGEIPSVLAETIAVAVRLQYEMHPYPNYGLLLPIQWQEGYASTALFAAQLLRERSLAPALDGQSQARILMAGCGEMFPAVLARWEPKSHRLEAIDLSQRSLMRARIRVAFAGRKCTFIQGDLAATATLARDEFSHIDAYGVLHHLASPLAGLARLSEALLPGGTLRLMVYNSEARTWIHHLQRAFHLLGLNGLDRSDVRETQALLRLLSAVLPALKERLEPMRESVLNGARCVDTFLHAREARLGLGEWIRAVEASGLKPLGLLDRYAELDDLPNPLYFMPSIAQLEERALDRRFENNLELYCYKPTREVFGRQPSLPMPWAIARRSPPQMWGSYEETRHLSWLQKWKLWQLFRRTIYRRGSVLPTQHNVLNPAAVGRLARIGALWPSTWQGREQLFHAPLHDHMENPQLPPPVDPLAVRALRSRVEQILLAKGRPLRYQVAILQRFAAAQVV